MRVKMLLVLLVSTLASTTAAQVLQDDQGDVVVTTRAGEQATAPAGARDLIDLLALDTSESSEALTLTIHVAGTDPVSQQDGATLQAGFRFGATEFLASLEVPGATWYKVAGASLARRPAGAADWQGGSVVEAAAAPDGSSYDIILPRELIVDEVGRTPRAGDELFDFWAHSADHMTQGTVVSAVGPSLLYTARDAMPDAGYGTHTFTFTLTPPSYVEVELTSPEPIRTSNGEQGTLVYHAFVTNHGNESRDIRLDVQDVPAQWNVQAATLALHLAPGATAGVPVLVAIPFSHRHGDLVSFTLTAIDLRGELLHTLTLGVKFLDVPQPAGHHSTLWLHARYPAPETTGLGGNGNSNPFASTIEGDNRSSGTPITYRYVDQAQAPAKYGWCIPYSPRLSIGLDLDLSRNGSASLALLSARPMEGTLRSRILVTNPLRGDMATPCAPDLKAVVIATMPETPVSLEAGDPHSIELPVKAAVDGVPHEANQDLIVEFELTLAIPNAARLADAPRIPAGASIRLPLNEFHEQPPALFGQGLRLEVTGEARRLRNPGGWAAFELRLDGEGTYELEAFGVNREWLKAMPATVLGGEVFTVHVLVPEDALDGEVSDLVLKTRGDGNVAVALARMVTEADTDATHVSDAAASSASRDTGALAWLACAAALATMAAHRRRDNSNVGAEPTR